MRDEAFITLVRKMNEEPQVTQQALDALLVARNLERVADHYLVPTAASILASSTRCRNRRSSSSRS